MGDWIQQSGRFLLVAGFVIAALGALLMLSGRIPWIGRLPGDFLIERKNFTLYFPLATSIVLSLFISLFLWLAGRR